MREFTSPPIADVPADLNIPDILEEQVRNNPQNALFGRQLTAGEWTDVSAKEFRDDVARIARGLAAAGVEQGDRVAIMSPTRYEWTLLDFAIMYAGAIVVPIYETSAPSQIAWIVQDSDVRAIFCETAQHKRAIDTAIRQERLEPMLGTWIIDGDGIEEVRQLADKGPSEAEMEARRSVAVGEDIATIIYTSGTTGKPKGCELTHTNFVGLSIQTLNTRLSETMNERASTVLFIPMAHVFARFISIISVMAGAKVGHTPQIGDLVSDLQSFKPSFLLAVPRVFEKVFNAAKAKADESGKGKIFAAGAQTAIDYSKAKQDGKVPFFLKARHALFNKILYGKIREAMGGEVTDAVSGGGPLGARLGHFFSGIGVNIYEGYGLTETTAPATVNRQGERHIGSVGKPLPGNAIRIADDGEILIKGVCVMKGYHNNPEETEKSFVDGWFASGDTGSLDERGFLTITGRKKELIVTAGGKNVSPAQLEDQIRSDMLVSQCMVVGDNKPFIAALITLDQETAPAWLKQHKMNPEMTIQEMAKDPKIREHIQKVVDKANKSVSRAESIREFRIVDEDFTIESGQMTPSLKIKREVITRDYQDVLDEIYSLPKPGSNS